MKSFPSLRYPLDRRTLTTEQGLALIAYDLLYKWTKMASISHLDKMDGLTLEHDTEAVLQSLGGYIEENIGEERFDLAGKVEL